VAAVPLALTFTAALAACTTQAEAPPPVAEAPRVPVVLAESRALPQERSFTGRVAAVHAVDIRPRAGGALEAVLFTEGAAVAKGAPLFVVDQRPYRIALQKAEADLATVRAELAHARDEFARAERLAAADAVSLEELERRRADVTRLQARLAGAEAAVADAGLDLEFTTVRAPVSGRLGRAEVTAGNLVTGGPDAGTRLAVLHSMDPVYVYFELDPATAAAARTTARAQWRALVSPLDGGEAVSAPIDFVDNGVGAQTGTWPVRARVPNRGGRLLPGAVVRVTFRYGESAKTVVVPELAIGTDQGTRFVLIATADNTVEYRAVATGAKAGPWRAVTNDAVRAGEAVILPGLPGIRPGITVAPVKEVLQ
jgi:RND family efflux transporter MFP subunit